MSRDPLPWHTTYFLKHLVVQEVSTFRVVSKLLFIEYFSFLLNDYRVYVKPFSCCPLKKIEKQKRYRYPLEINNCFSHLHKPHF